MRFSSLEDSYLAAWKGHSPPFYTSSPAFDAQAESQECSQWTSLGEHWEENEREEGCDNFYAFHISHPVIIATED